MKRYSVVSIAVLSTLVGAPTWAQSPTDFALVDAELKACSDRDPSIPGSADCTKVAAAAADRRLNEVYSKVVYDLKHPGPDHAPYDPEIPKRLIAAERAWIAFRDGDCSYRSTVALGAPLEGFEYVDCLYTETKARVKTLTAPDAPQNAR